MYTYIIIIFFYTKYMCTLLRIKNIYFLLLFYCAIQMIKVNKPLQIIIYRGLVL